MNDGNILIEQIGRTMAATVVGNKKAATINVWIMTLRLEQR